MNGQHPDNPQPKHRATNRVRMASGSGQVPNRAGCLAPVAPAGVVARDVIRVLAIDPSIQSCGWAVITPGQTPRRIDSGTWHPSKARGCADRFLQLTAFVRGLVSAHRPTRAVVEINSGGIYRLRGTTAITYGRAIQSAIDGAWLEGCELLTPTVNEWKGTGAKCRTEAVVKAVFRYAPGTDDESDALGLALWGAGRGAE